MNTIKESIAAILLSVSLLGFTGCSTIGSGTVQDPVPLIKTAAYVGSFYALQEHPEWRPGFEIALAELKILEQSETIDWTVLMSIVNRLPVNELRSNDATVIITAGTMILAQYGQGVLDVEKHNQIQAVVVALRQGMELALVPASSP